MNVSPQEMMRRTKEWAKNIEKARSSSVAVGLPVENVGGKIYGDGESVISVGAAHEYGAGVPRRSFLRVPYQVQKDLIARTINSSLGMLPKKAKTQKEHLVWSVRLPLMSARELLLHAAMGFGQTLASPQRTLKGPVRCLLTLAH